MRIKEEEGEKEKKGRKRERERQRERERVRERGRERKTWYNERYKERAGRRVLLDVWLCSSKAYGSDCIKHTAGSRRHTHNHRTHTHTHSHTLTHTCSPTCLLQLVSLLVCLGVNSRLCKTEDGGSKRC